MITNTMLLVALSLFFKYHIKLLLENSTTIEDLDKKINPGNTTYVNL